MAEATKIRRAAALRNLAEGPARKIRSGEGPVIGPSDSGFGAPLIGDLALPPGGVPVTHRLPDDPFFNLAKTGTVIGPPFPLDVLSTLPEEGSELALCIQAMVTNIDSFGHRLDPRYDPELDPPPAVKKRVAAEERVVGNFLRNSTYGVEGWTQTRRNLRTDLEATGNSYLEVVTRPLEDNGAPVGLMHVPSWTMRLMPQDIEYTEYLEPVLLQAEEFEWKWEKRRSWRRFRRYMQIKEGRKVYFKEWNDPRDLDRFSGYYGTVEHPVHPQRRASEVIHQKLYCPRSPYGLPRWLGALFCVYGTRAADEINYVTFRNNHVPSMFVLVSNGQLTQESIDRLAEYIEQKVAADDNRSKFVVLEGEPATEGLKESPNVKIDIKPMREVQQADAMFVQYVKTNNDRTRRMFRLPPLLTGAAEEYTRATADAARRVADEQVFQPERDVFDEVIDRTILARLDVALLRFRSQVPTTTDTGELVNVLSAAERTGGLTPNIARRIVSQILGLPLGRIKLSKDASGVEFDGDRPFTLTLAEAVKNQGPVRAGTLPHGSKPVSTPAAATGKQPNRLRSQKAAGAEEATPALVDRPDLSELLQEAMLKYLGQDFRNARVSVFDVDEGFSAAPELGPEETPPGPEDATGDGENGKAKKGLQDPGQAPQGVPDPGASVGADPLLVAGLDGNVPNEEQPVHQPDPARRWPPVVRTGLDPLNTESNGQLRAAKVRRPARAE